MYINNKNDPQEIFDKHYSLNCPHCSAHSNISAISIPRYEYLTRFKPQEIGIAYRCDACNKPIFLKFTVRYDLGNHRIQVNDEYTEIELARESFEFQYLKGDVEQDFREALICYSSQAFNGFAAMCRRTVQSICTDGGVEGTHKVEKQLKELKELAQIDDETFSVLKQIMIDGHDGAHPHLPKLNQQRATVLLELMKDVLYQLYVRKGKLQEAMALRQTAIAEAKNDKT